MHLVNDSARCSNCGATVASPDASCPYCLLLLGLNDPVAPPVGPGFLDSLPAPDPGLVIAGKYRVLRVVARGGMGVVYEATQENLARPVAIKVLSAGVYADAEIKKRFALEAMSVAKLQHPSIVTIYDTGEDQGQPFIAMEYVEGTTLAQLIRERPMEPMETAKIVEQICRAVHYAHSQGILHRDLKPSNIILDRDRLPKITDFGLAGVLGANSELTQTGQAIGSPGFLPPEQVSSKDMPIGPASDVYGAGATLYCLLTGRPPFAADTTAKTLNQVAHDEPVPLRKLNRGIPDDLETICLKCLEKEPGRRYASAEALADELQRFLECKPIHARPIGLIGKTARWCRRRPAMAVLVALVIGLSIAMAAVGIHAARSAIRAARADAKVATTLKDEQLRRAFFLDSQYSRLALQQAGWFQRVSNSVVMPARTRPDLEIRNQMADTLRGLDATVRERWEGFEDLQIATSPPGSHILIPCKMWSSDPGSNASVPRLRVWNYQTGQTNEFRLRGKGPVALFSNAMPIQLVVSPTNRFSYEFWNLAENERWREFTMPLETPPDGSSLASVKPKHQFSADGRLVALIEPLSPTTGMICVLETATGRPLLQAGLPYAWKITAAAFSPDGSFLAAGATDGYVSIWSLANGRQWRSLRDSSAEIRSLAFHRESRSDSAATNDTGWLLAVGDSSRVIALWEIATSVVRHRFSGHPTDEIVFGPDGTTLACGGSDEVWLWDVATSRPLLKIPAGPMHRGLRFSEDGQQLFVASKGVVGGRMEVWNIENGRGVQTLRGLRGQISRVCFSGNGRRVAAFGRHEITVWDRIDGRRVRVWNVPQELRGMEAALALNEDGTELTFASEITVRRWDVATGKLIMELTLRPAIGNTLGFPAPGRLMLFRLETTAPDGVPYQDIEAKVVPRVCRMYDLTQNNPQKPVLEDQDLNHIIYEITGSTDGRFFVVDGSRVSEAEPNRFLVCFDSIAAQRRWQRSLGSGHALGNLVRIDSAGHTLVVTDNQSAIGMSIELSSGSELPIRWNRYPVALGPDGTNWVAWNLKERRGLSLFAGFAPVPLVTLGIDSPIEDGSPAFSRDGNLIAWGQANGSMLLFDLREMRQRMAALGLGW
jgi:WD40 repeat protein/predicted Ser/Thr protein kinase